MYFIFFRKMCFNPFQVVSKPIGSVLSAPEAEYVSIPFRQSQNWYIISLKILKGGCFNPFQVVSKRGDFLNFSFLILRFQSLLGSLKTFLLILCLALDGIVSIPFRQSQNRPWILQVFNGVLVSIPFRQSRNLHYQMESASLFIVSIPFRQSQNTIRKRLIIIGISGFNPFQVVSKLERRGQHSGFHSLFQSLLGSLKTIGQK